MDENIAKEQGVINSLPCAERKCKGEAKSEDEDKSNESKIQENILNESHQLLSKKNCKTSNKKNKKEIGDQENAISSNTFVRGKDVFERMNYLYQLSHHLSVSNPELSSYYTKLMISISKKSVLRIDPSIKQTICKGCFTFLVPQVTCRQHYTRNHGGQNVRICNVCGVPKRIPVPLKKHKPKRLPKKLPANKRSNREIVNNPE